MTEVNIYDQKANIVNVLTLPDGLEHVSGRTSRVGNVFYKGVGVEYKGHATLSPKASEDLVGDNAVFYYGKTVVNPNWVGKHGIFQQRYQPYFSDYVGSCGPKELAIVDNSKKCEKSAVVVEDCINYDKDNKQMYFILGYPKGRSQYLSDGTPDKLVGLIKYMIGAGWNFPWDKTAIRDVSADGDISDVADMFVSKSPTHQLGTVYSVLYSLHVLGLQKYKDLLNYIHTPYSGLVDIPFLSLSILKGCGVDIDVFSKVGVESTPDTYFHLVGNYLLRGRNCSSVETVETGEKISKQYVKRFIKFIPKDKRYLVR